MEIIEADAVPALSSRESRDARDGASVAFGVGGADDGERTDAHDGAAEEPSLFALIADTSGSILGVVAEIDRLSARQAACKAALIDQARRVALMTEEAVVTVGKTFSSSQRQDLARRAFVSEVACELRIHERSAIVLVNESETLVHRLPHTFTALLNCEISYRHAQRLIDQIIGLDDDDAARLEEIALPFARTMSPAKFGQKARVLRERLSPESAGTRREKSASDRKVEFTPACDGMAWLTLYTTAPVAGALLTAIRSQSLRLQGATEGRTLGQLDADVCADAMLAVLSGEPLSSADASGCVSASTPRWRAGADPDAAFRRLKPTVTVTVPVLSLLGKSDELATLDGYGPIDVETARRLVGQATSFTRVLTDPETGAALSWGTKHYKPTKRMRAFLHYRDQTCRFPGCSRRADGCDIDHTRAHAFGGETVLDNLACLCPKHHRTKHDTTWNVKQVGGGTLEWTSPHGRRFTTSPENEVRPFGSTGLIPHGSRSQTESTSKNEAPPEPSSDPPPF